MAGDQRGRAAGKEMSRITNGHGLCPRGSVCRVLPFPCPTACLQPCRAAARLRALVLDVCPGGPSGLHPLCPCVHQFSSPRRSLPQRNPLSNEYLLGVTAGREPGAPQDTWGCLSEAPAVHRVPNKSNVSTPSNHAAPSNEVSACSHTWQSHLPVHNPLLFGAESHDFEL